jgi:hypothetical protein
MFEKVSDSRLAGRLVGRPDPVPDHVNDDRGAVILYYDRFQSVLKHERCDSLGSERSRKGEKDRRQGKNENVHGHSS